MKKTIGSHPGAINFRLSVMVVLILLFIVFFLYYFDDTQKEIERASILQTKKIIDSALTIVFASHVTKGRLNELAQLDGGNPFDFLREYQLVPPAYQGEVEKDTTNADAPGWYYLKHHKSVIYKSRFIGTDSHFRVSFDYEDKNGTGKFESDSDRFKSLQFVKLD